MNTYKENSDRADRLLSSLDGIQPAEPAPFFYTRLRAKMQQQVQEKPVAVFALRPALLAASLLLVFMLNILFLVKPVTRTNREPQKPPATGIQAFAESYNLDNSSALYE